MRNNRTAGHSWECTIAEMMRAIGFEFAVTSRSESKSRDDAKIDIMNTEEGINGRLPYNIQCKNMATKLDYPGVLAQMPKGEEINVILHNHTVKRAKLFVTKGQYAVMTMGDFFRLIDKINRLEANQLKRRRKQ